MSYEIIAIPKFEKQLKRLARKYPSLKTEYIRLVKSLEQEPLQGTAIGNNCYKIRLAIGSKGKGKSVGARVISHTVVTATSVYLVAIYDKSEKENLSDKELDDLLKFIPQ